MPAKLEEPGTDPLRLPALEFGEYPVGFRLGFELDASRSYPQHSPARPSGQTERKHPRPILFAIWFPAGAVDGEPRMPYGGYLELTDRPWTHLPFETAESKVPAMEPHGRDTFALFSRRLGRYFRDNLAEAVYGVVEHALPEAKRARFRDLLELPTHVYRNAPVADGCFPLVIYHPGLEGGYEENSLLCEALASHGYVVVSSAYQPQRPSSLGIENDRALSTADMGYIFNALHGLPFVNWQKVAAMGHSYGAGIAFRLRRQNDVVDAIVSLDSTSDYDKWLSEDFLTDFRQARRKLGVPMLVTAGATAEFSILRSLRYAERHLMTVEGLRHDDWLAHEAIRAALEADPADADDGQPAPALILDHYRYQAELVRIFLDHALKDDPAAKQNLLERSGTKRSGLARLRHEHLPADRLPPTFDAFVAQMEAMGAAEAIRWCRMQPGANTESPLFQRGALNRLGYDCIARAEPEEAVTIFEFMTELYPDSSYGWDSLAEGHLARGDPSAAIRAYEAALESLDRDQEITDQERELDRREYCEKIAALLAP